jgi:hypothetical protein
MKKNSLKIKLKRAKKVRVIWTRKPQTKIKLDSRQKIRYTVPLAEFE